MGTIIKKKYFNRNINKQNLKKENGHENIFWQLYAQVYDLIQLIPLYQSMLNDVELASNIKRTDVVLDAGCGTGNFIHHMIQKYNGAKYIGIDISKNMLIKAKKKINTPNVRFFQADFNKKLPFSSNYFDHIIAINSIYTTKNPNFTILELFRVLKLGGTLVIVNPHSKTKFSKTYFRILNSGKMLEKVLLLFITIPLFFFNVIIKIKANNRSYHFFGKSDWKRIVKKYDIRLLKISPTYVQSHLIKIIK